jgi:hypothetical protein
MIKGMELEKHIALDAGTENSHTEERKRVMREKGSGLNMREKGEKKGQVSTFNRLC